MRAGRLFIAKVVIVGARMRSPGLRSVALIIKGRNLDAFFLYTWKEWGVIPVQASHRVILLYVMRLEDLVCS